MFNGEKRFIAYIIAIFVFQLLFPQYSYAHGIEGVKTNAEASFLAVANFSEVVMFEGDENYRQAILPDEKLPDSGPRQPVRKMKVVVTAYSSTVDQCDGDPFTMANGKRVHDGAAAANFLPFGSKFKLPQYFGDKMFTVEDRMNPRYTYRVDIWMPTREEAKQFGVRYLEIEVY